MVPQPPLLAIKRNLSFCAAASLDTLSSSTSQAYGKGYYEDLLLYDAAGGLWPVLEAVPTQRFSLLTELFPWRRIRVQLHLGERMEGDFREVKEWLCQILHSNSGFEYYRGPSPEELERRVQEAKSPLELIQATSLIGD